MKRGVRNWIIAATGVVVLSAVISYMSLFGHWRMSIFGVTHQCIWDPGGAYIGSALTLFDEKYPSFVGHPGLPLMAILHLTAKVYYLVFKSGVPGISFDQFAAKNLFYLIFLSKLLITMTHILCFYLIYLLTVELTKEKIAGSIAAIAYATTFPVLIYLNNISPEPIMLVSVLLCIIGCRRYLINRNSGSVMKQYCWIILIALSCVTGFYSKMNILAAFPLFIPFYLIFSSRRQERQEVTLRSEVRDVSLLVFFIIIFLFIFGYKLDWPNFFKFWFYYSPGSPEYSTSANWVVNIMNNGEYLFINFMDLVKGFVDYRKWLPGFRSKGGLFILAEMFFSAGALAGLILFWKYNENRRRQVIWLLSLLVVVSPAAILKGSGGWHYFFIHLSIMAVFFGYAVFRMLQAEKNLTRIFAFSVGIILLTHAFSIFFFFSCKKNDMKQYQLWRPYYQALNKIHYDEKIAINEAYPGYVVDISGRVINFIPQYSGFYKAFTNFFVDINTLKNPEQMKQMKVRYHIIRSGDGTIKATLLQP